MSITKENIVFFSAPSGMYTSSTGISLNALNPIFLPLFPSFQKKKVSFKTDLFEDILFNMYIISAETKTSRAK
jgi:hypothetical protein